MRDDGVIDDKVAFEAAVVFFCGLGIVIIVLLAWIFN